MGSFTTEAADLIVSWVIDSDSVVPYTAPLMCRLMSANGDDDTELGTEVVGNAYEPQEIRFSTVASRQASNSSMVLFSSLDSDTEVTVVGAEVWDSSPTPRRVGVGAFPSGTVVPAGGPFSIPVGALVLGVL
jgi:hypothetical protein